MNTFKPGLLYSFTKESSDGLSPLIVTEVNVNPNSTTKDTKVSSLNEVTETDLLVITLPMLIDTNDTTNSYSNTNITNNDVLTSIDSSDDIVDDKENNEFDLKYEHYSTSHSTPLAKEQLRCLERSLYNMSIRQEPICTQCSFESLSMDPTETSSSSLSPCDCPFSYAMDLDKQGIDIVRTGYDVSLLYYACKYGNLPLVKYLLHHGAVVNFQVPKYNNNSPLIEAAASSHSEIVQILVDNGADVNIVNDFNHTALTFASFLSLEIVQILINAEANVNCSSHNIPSPLVIASVYEEIGIIQTLIHAGADVNPKLYLSLKNRSLALSLLTIAVGSENLDLVKLLLHHRIQLEQSNVVYNHFDFLANDPVHLSLGKISESHSISMFKLLLSTNIDVDMRTMKDRSILEFSIFHDNYLTTKLLLEHGADYNAKNANNHYPIVYVCIYGSFEHIKLLCSYNPDISLTKGGAVLCNSFRSIDIARFIFDFAEKQSFKIDLNETNKDGYDCISTEILKQNLDLIKFYVSHGALINETNYSIIPLVLSPEFEDISITKYLLTLNLDVNIKSRTKMTPLLIAVSHNNVRQVRLLLDHGADINVTNQHGLTPLYLAARYNLYETVLELLRYNRENQSNLDINAIVPDSGQTAIFDAIYLRLYDVVKALLEEGADVTIPSYEGVSVVSSVKDNDMFDLLLEHNIDVNLPSTKTNFLMNAIIHKYPGVDTIIERGADIHAVCHNNRSIVFYACQKNNLPLVKKLVEAGVDIDLSDEFEMSPLLIAAQSGYLEILEYLLSQNADVSSVSMMNSLGKEYSINMLYLAVENNHLHIVQSILKDNKYIHMLEEPCRGGMTPLLLAACSGYLEIVQFLIGRGADINATSENNENCLVLATMHSRLKVCKYLLSINMSYPDQLSKIGILKACASGNLDLVKYQCSPEMLKAYDCTVNDLLQYTSDKGRTPLLTAVTAGHLEVVEYLLSIGANINDVCNRQKNALILAVEFNHLHLVKFFLKAGLNVNHSCDSGMAALHFSSNYDNINMAQLLLKHKADVNDVTNDLFTPLLIAIKRPKPSIEFVQLLLEKKANVNHQNKFYQTPLSLVASSELDQEKTLSLLIDFGVDLRGSKGISALLKSANYGLLPIVVRLLANGVDVNGSLKDNWTPLMAASNKGHLQIVKVLVIAGADVTLRGGEELLTAEEYARKAHQHDVGEYLSKLDNSEYVNVNPITKQSKHYGVKYNNHSKSNFRDTNTNNFENNQPFKSYTYKKSFEKDNNTNPYHKTNNPSFKYNKESPSNPEPYKPIHRRTSENPSTDTRNYHNNHQYTSKTNRYNSSGNRNTNTYTSKTNSSNYADKLLKRYGSLDNSNDSTENNDNFKNIESTSNPWKKQTYK